MAKPNLKKEIERLTMENEGLAERIKVLELRTGVLERENKSMHGGFIDEIKGLSRELL